MERVAVLLDGRRCGELTAERQGLYMGYRAVCRLSPSTAPVRLFAVGEGGEIRLGVPQPEGQTFLLERRLPFRETDRLGRLLRGELRFSAQKERNWQKYGGAWEQLLGTRLAGQLRGVAGALVSREEDRWFLAVPFETGRVFPLAELFCLASVQRIGRTEYAVFAFDREGRPVPQIRE